MARRQCVGSPDPVAVVEGDFVFLENVGNHLIRTTGKTPEASMSAVLCAASQRESPPRVVRLLPTGWRRRQGQAARLRSGRAVGDRSRTAKGVQGLLDSEQRRRLELGQRAAAADGDRDRRHGDVVGSFPEAVAVVRAERVPEAVQFPADGLR